MRLSTAGRMDGWGRGQSAAEVAGRLGMKTAAELALGRRMWVGGESWMTVAEILAMEAEEPLTVGQYDGPEFSPWQPKRGEDVTMALADRHFIDRWDEAARLALAHSDRAPIGIWSAMDRGVIAIVHQEEFWFL